MLCSLDLTDRINSYFTMDWNVSFQLQKSDLTAASYNLLLHNPWTWVSQGIFIAIVTYLMISMPKLTMNYLLLAVVVIVFFSGMYLVSPLWRARQLGKEKELQGPIDWQLSQTTMTIQSKAGSRSFPYGLFQFAIFGKRLLIMRQEKGNRNSIFPLKTFNSEQDKIAFKQFLFDRLSEGKKRNG